MIDGYSVLGVSTKFEDTQEAILEDTTPLGVAWEESTYVEMKRASLTQEGYYDDAAGSSNEALSGNEGTSRVLCYGLQGNTIGQHFVGFSGAMQADYKRIVARAQLHKANASYKGSGIVEEGEILHALGAETDASGDTEATSVDGGAGNAPSTDGGTGYLQVSALTLGGYTNVVIKVRDSADDIAYGDLITFAAVTAAPAAERATVAGNVERYVASSYAFGGAGAAQSVTYMVGFVRN